ncbi:MAG TPA: SUMF1/EgtB/PvdO family nonheme iron enzyme [Anaerolineae bacterium]
MDYDTVRIRRFLIERFNDNELRTLCFDYFRDVYLEFTTGMGMSQMVQNLIEHCVRHGRIPDLLAALERERPQLYPQYFASQPELQIERPAPAHAPPQRNPRQIFISHAQQNAAFAQRLAGDLKAHNYAVWIAPDSIRPGEKWVEAISRGLDESGVFVLVLTPHAVKSQWVRRETDAAIEMEHEGEMNLVPLLVEPSRVPALWRVYQRISFRSDYDAGLKSLLEHLNPDMDSLSRQVVSVGEEAIAVLRPAPSPPVQEATRDRMIWPKTGKEMVRIPAGEFLYGEKKEKVHLDEYWIGKTPVTHAEYKRLLDANPKHPVPFTDRDWARPYNWDQKRRTYPADKVGHPVVLVSWRDAKAYADWAGVRLPTEQEWEKAARGTDGRAYPWGNRWRKDHCNTREAGINGTTVVGRFSPRGDSPYGCVNMAGNVWEWTESWDDETKDRRVLRGGSWFVDQVLARAAARNQYRPSYRYSINGFRVVVVRRPLSDGRVRRETGACNAS